MPIAVRPLAGVIGAEVTDVDLTRPLSYPVVVEIERALLEHLVLVFPDQPVSEAQHIDFARQFGEIQPPPSRPATTPTPSCTCSTRPRPAAKAPTTGTRTIPTRPSPPWARSCGR